ncbi:MAG: serine O-acetyltransferase [Saprospiraceae bacterium]|jgi:serine O-acetyltransferase
MKSYLCYSYFEIVEKKFINKLIEEHLKAPKCATPSVVGAWFKSLVGVLFPGFCDVEYKSETELSESESQLKLDLFSILQCNKENDNKATGRLVDLFFLELERIHDLLQKDIQAIYDGDPAAKSFAEIIRSYPGFYAMSAHRVAHQLNKLGIALVPRIISENAHSHTGVDIHPGATIGEYFCIDHGTGVVIGETTVVGSHVKVYQGVTLGALSVTSREVKEQRHPTILNGVIIYAGATILGGRTVVGNNSVIGGGVWLTKSVADNSKVYYRAKMSHQNGEPDTMTFKP